MKNSVKIFSNKKLLRPAEAAALYIELGWGTAKTYSVARMRRSLANCDIVVFARNGAGELIGIARALSDFAIETKILDMIIAPEYQRQGLGTKMMREIEWLACGTNIYCETENKNFGFVAKLGFKRRKGLAVFVKKR
jgi:ribosomal protein S18 acetylase RimI-like enzyme